MTGQEGRTQPEREWTSKRVTRGFNDGLLTRGVWPISLVSGREDLRAKYMSGYIHITFRLIIIIPQINAGTERRLDMSQLPF